MTFDEVEKNKLYEFSFSSSIKAYTYVLDKNEDIECLVVKTYSRNLFSVEREIVTKKLWNDKDFIYILYNKLGSGAFRDVITIIFEKDLEK